MKGVIIITVFSALQVTRLIIWAPTNMRKLSIFFGKCGIIENEMHMGRLQLHADVNVFSITNSRSKVEDDKHKRVLLVHELLLMFLNLQSILWNAVLVRKISMPYSHVMSHNKQIMMFQFNSNFKFVYMQHRFVEDSRVHLINE